MKNGNSKPKKVKIVIPNTKRLELIIFENLLTKEGIEFIAEFAFFPERKWRVDYMIINGCNRVAVEVEGGIWTGGRHTSPQGFIKDMEKYNKLSECGIFLLRYSYDNLIKKETIEQIKVTLTLANCSQIPK